MMFCDVNVWVIGGVLLSLNLGVSLKFEGWAQLWPILGNNPLQWRHNELDGVSNHRCLDYFLNRFFRRKSKKHQSSASLAFVRGIHRWPVNSPHKGSVTLKIFPFDDVVMISPQWTLYPPDFSEPLKFHPELRQWHESHRIVRNHFWITNWD